MHLDQDTFKISGLTVRVRYFDDSEAPWDNCDGHGPVRKSNSPHRDGSSDKRPGERPLNSAGRNKYQFYYDWQAALKTAAKDGWNAEPYDAPNRAQRAVEADFKFLQGYVEGRWSYVGIEAVVLNDDGEPIGEPDQCGGFETYKNYHLEAAKDMAKNVAATYLQDIADAARAEHIANRYRDAINLGIAA